MECVSKKLGGTSVNINEIETLFTCSASWSDKIKVGVLGFLGLLVGIML